MFEVLVAGASLRCRAEVIDRPAVAARNDMRITQRVWMCGQIGAAHDATGGEMQVDAEERRIVVIHLAAASCRIAGVGELPDTVNLDGVEPTGGVADESADVADRG
ncbi:hypothetical protein BOC60_09785 [Burkholderia pseudomallei]|nr:hypothetical protein BOC60_09785 [Burkholderia pseudomallei]